MNQVYASPAQPQPQPQPPRAQPMAARAPARAGAWSSLRHLAHLYLVELTVALAVVLRFTSETYNVASFVLMALVAFMGRNGTIYALVGVWFIHAVNPGLAEETPLGSTARYLVVIAAVVAAAFRSARRKAGEPAGIAVVTTAAVAAMVIVHSAAFSVYPSLSLFKAGYWAAVAMTLVSTLRSMSDEDMARLQRFLMVFFGAILVLSLAVMPLPEARLRNGVGLQGLLNHPQMFGVFCALSGAYFFGSAIASKTPSWVQLGFILLALLGIMESGARTGGFALILACLGVIALAVVRSASFFREALPGLFSGRFAVLIAVSLVAGIANSDVVRQTTEQFVRKSSRAEQATVAYQASRGFLIQEMLDNIERNPAQGIGLGILSATHLMDVETDETTGIPVSAPVEKGVMWIAVFEELGLILGSLVLAWILWGTARSILAGAAAATASLSYFMTNFAEATFFSPGGAGMIGLIFFFMGMTRASRARQAAAATGLPGLAQAPAQAPPAGAAAFTLP